MARSSRSANVRKRCPCESWKTCAHPWYLDFQRKGYPRFRDNLDQLIGFHPRDFRHAADEARRAITAKLDGRDPAALLPGDDPTLGQLLEDYLRERPRVDTWQAPRIARTPVQGRPFGEWRLSLITTDVVRAFRRGRPRVQGSRDLGLLRAAFNWAILNGVLKASPFRVENVPIIRLPRETARSRRLQPGESERLLGAATGLLDIIYAAIETGMRCGEILSLQWQQVRFLPRAEMFLPAAKTKTKHDRRVPISSVLRPVLERRRRDPAGDELPPDAYVFGDEIGRRRGAIKTAWQTTLKRAGITDLHFHDLRREAGSRWMDAGVPLATIQRWLGHANISQTSTYLGASLGADEYDMERYEAQIGRRPSVTQSDISRGSKGAKVPRVATTRREKPQQTLRIH